MWVLLTSPLCWRVGGGVSFFTRFPPIFQLLPIPPVICIELCSNHTYSYSFPSVYLLLKKLHSGKQNLRAHKSRGGSPTTSGCVFFLPPTDQTPAMLFPFSSAEPAAYKLKSFLGITRQDLPSWILDSSVVDGYTKFITKFITKNSTLKNYAAWGN